VVATVNTVFILNFFILAFFGAIFLIDGLAEN